MNYLRLTTALFVFLLMASSATAQLGIRAGVNLSDQLHDPDDYLTTSSIVGWNLGLMVELVMTDRFALQPEAHFIQKGANLVSESPFSPTQSDLNYTFNSLMMAIMARYEIVQFGESGNIYLGVTPFFTYHLDILVDGETTTGNDVREIDESYKSRDLGLRRADYGVGFGLGLRFGGFVVDARYNLGLANIDRSETTTINSRGILLGIGYYF